MVIYADYEYYKKSYLEGATPTIDENEFPLLSLKASQLINMYTFNRVPDMTSVPEEVKMCCCELIGIFHTEKLQLAAIPTDGKTAEKVGDYSVSYGVTYKDVADIEKRFQSKKQECIETWLLTTGLLYRGVPYVY